MYVLSRNCLSLANALHQQNESVAGIQKTRAVTRDREIMIQDASQRQTDRQADRSDYRRTEIMKEETSENKLLPDQQKKTSYLYPTRYERTEQKVEICVRK